MKLKVLYCNIGRNPCLLLCTCICKYRSLWFNPSDSNGKITAENGDVIDIKLEDILVFATGASEVPPMGFDEQPSVSFKNPDEVGGALPSASTCSNTMYLPVHDTYGTFKDKFLFGITCAVGFGNV